MSTKKKTEIKIFARHHINSTIILDLHSSLSKMSEQKAARQIPKKRRRSERKEQKQNQQNNGDIEEENKIAEPDVEQDQKQQQPNLIDIDLGTLAVEKYRVSKSLVRLAIDNVSKAKPNERVISREVRNSPLRIFLKVAPYEFWKFLTQQTNENMAKKVRAGDVKGKYA